MPTSVVLLLKTCNFGLIMRKQSEKCRLVDIFIKYPTLLHTRKVIQNRSLRNLQLRDAKEDTITKCNLVSKPCPVGRPKTVGPWERSIRMWFTGEGNGEPLQYSSLENPMNSMNKQKDRTLKDELPGQWVPNMLLEISGGITPERMKDQSQSKNSTQLWLWLVIEAKFSAVKINIA